MKIVIAPDSFKGSLTSSEVCEVIETALTEENPNFEIVKTPLADGGEGTSEILKQFYPVSVMVEAHDPLGREIISGYHCNEKGDKVFIESAEVIGLTLLSERERNPLNASSYGLGEIIKKAIKNGAREISISLGGTATSDGGVGMMAAIGYQFLDSDGNRISPVGKNLSRICEIKEPKDCSFFKNIKFTSICDVNNPLIGPNGAAYVYAAQKGAKEQELPILDKCLQSFAEVVHSSKYCDDDLKFKESMGAAGGICFSLAAFFNSKIIRGIDFILNHIGFSDKIKDADFIITGEGKIDKQSIMGKVVSGILRFASLQQIPVIALAGKVEDKKDLIESGIKVIYEISSPDLSLAENMNPSQSVRNIYKIIQESVLPFILKT